MRNAKVFLCATFFLAFLACAVLIVSGPTTTAGEKNASVGAQKGAVGNHWRHHDGRWSYWHEGDRRWYYTDGSNWFYNNGNGNGNDWNIYGFDKQFGRDGFERGDYKMPENGTKIELPRHGTFGPATKTK